MPFNDVYRRQVGLLVRTIPHVAEENCFALKGGTAINLFYRDMPRLSVDIDLTYQPIADRKESLAEIEAALRRIGSRIKKADKRITVNESAPGTQDTINKLVVRTPDRVQIKIEVTPVLRGCVYDPKVMSVSARTEDAFGFAEMNVLSFADLFAGKIVAALDRQHPRDLFDVHQLLENEGVSAELRTALIVYLISHDRAPHSLLSATCRDLAHDYEQNFRGMAETDVVIEVLQKTHTAIARNVLLEMPEDHQRFLVSFYRRDPDWSLLGVDGAEDLPAVKWREANLDNAGEETRNSIADALEALFATPTSSG